MAEGRLDQIVKGAPQSSTKPPPTVPLQNISTASLTPSTNPTTDPLSTLPSSPPQIYLNLLILESSLRAQYLQLVSRRRLHTFFLLLLLFWIASFLYLLFLRPREDGLGHGGSVYWVVETLEKVALLGGLVTLILFIGTGQWERGIRWPRRWVGTTNRGLRVFNLRVVVVRGAWWRELPAHFAFLLPFLNTQSSGADWHWVEYSRSAHGGQHTHPHHTPTNNLSKSSSRPSSSPSPHPALIEEDLSPGNSHISLLLLPKSFSADFRENWALYRRDYWERENERRANLRRRVTQQRRARAHAEGGWNWWTGAWRLHRSHQGNKSGHNHHQHQSSSTSMPPPASSLSSATGKTHDLRSSLTASTSSTTSARRRSFLRSDSTPSHSRQSSRSSTPTVDGDDPAFPISGGRDGPARANSTRKKSRDKTRGRAVISPLTRAGSSSTSAEGAGGQGDGRPGSAGSMGSFSSEDGGGGAASTEGRRGRGGGGTWGRGSVYA